MTAAVAYVNGEFVARDTARVSIMDRGLLFADAVYEVIPVYGGQPFRLDHHLQRLARSLAELHIDNPLDDANWGRLVDRLTADNGGGDLSVYLQVTRGAAEDRDHWSGAPTQPTVIGFTGPMHGQTAATAETGVNIVTRPDPRWQRCDIKATALLPNVLARRQARDAGALEAVFHRDEVLTEGAATNVFIVVDGVVLTPALGPLLLAGVTRQAVIDYLGTADITCRQQAVTIDMLRGADEVWLTSSTREILPVTQADNRPIADGRPGPLWRTVQPGFAAWARAAAHPHAPTTLLEHG